MFVVHEVPSFGKINVVQSLIMAHTTCSFLSQRGKCQTAYSPLHSSGVFLHGFWRFTQIDGNNNNNDNDNEIDKIGEIQVILRLPQMNHLMTRQCDLFIYRCQRVFIELFYKLMVS